MTSARTEEWERVVRERARVLQQNLAALQRWVEKAGGQGEEGRAVYELLARPTLDALDTITFRAAAMKST